MENNHQYSELRDKITAGINLAFQRLVEKAKITDDYLVFSEKGKIVHVKARTIK